MATPLNDLTEKSFQPLDLNTPVVNRLLNPTPAFAQHQKSFRKVLIDQSKNTNAAIIEEREVRAEADYASALLVDQVTAEALGFTAAILMKMEVEIAPTGVLARYKIVASLDPGGDLVTTGMYFDIVEDPLNPGEYLGEITLDADRLKLGRADEAGSFPFYIDGGIVYIETAVIKNLSIGTEKVSPNAATDVVVALQVGDLAPGSDFIVQGVPVESDPNITGMMIVFFGFMNRPTIDSSNFGDWKMSLERNGVVIDETPPQFYDDNFAYPVVAAWFDETPGIDPVYTISSSTLSGLGLFVVRDGSLATFTLLKR